MAYNFHYNGTSADRGRVSFGLIDTPLTFSNVFSGAPQLYRGSSFVIEEVLEIRVKVEEDSRVQIALDYYTPRRKLGNYQLAESETDLFFLTEGNYGFLVCERTKIKRYKTFTIQGHPDAPLSQGEPIALGDCNYRLVPELIQIDSVFVPGFKPLHGDNMFSGQMFWSRAELEDTPFFPSISSLGLFLAPFVSVVSLDYTVGIVNTINVVAHPQSAIACSSANTCDLQFQAFLATSDFIAAAAQTLIDRYGCSPEERLFTSPVDPSCTRVYYYCPSA